MAQENKTTDNTTYEYVDQLYREPVSGGTRKVGWFLTVASLISVSAIALDIDTTPTPILTLGLSLTPDQFRMLSILTVVGLLLAFLLYATIDFFQKKEIDHHLTVRIHSQVRKWLKLKADEQAELPYVFQEEDQGPEDDYAVAVYSELVAHMDKTQKITRAQIDKIIDRRAALRLRNFRFWAAIIVPVLLATISIWVGWEYLTMLGVAFGESLFTQT